MDFEQRKERLRQIAQECVSKGPGYAQEGVVMREARTVFGPGDLEHEQLTLEAWHCLFKEAIFDWGHNLDNPGAPFFHQAVQRVATGRRGELTGARRSLD